MKKPKKPDKHKYKSDEPDGDYEYMANRKKLLKGSKQKARKIKRANRSK